jgi:hypothetical protein
MPTPKTRFSHPKNFQFSTFSHALQTQSSQKCKKTEDLFYFLFFRFVGQILRKKGQTRNRIAATFFRLSALKLKN